jgi:hypothetical protein
MPEADQEKLADQLCLLIEKAGIADATLENIRLRDNRTWVILDTEPSGLMVPKGDLNNPQGHSVEKCGRIGLCTLQNSAKKYQLDHFSKCVTKNYQKSLQDVSICRVVLSILCPLIPLIFLVISVINTLELEKIAKTPTKDLALKKRFISLIDGVPFTAAPL